MKYANIDPRTKLKPGEPYFFVRAQDVHAPVTVMVHSQAMFDAGDTEGAAEVARIASQMKQWQDDHPSAVKNPD